MGVCKYGISPLVFNSISHYRAQRTGWIKRHWVNHEKRNSISTRAHALSYLIHKHSRCLVPRKFPKQPCLENVKGIALHSSTWQSGAKGEWRVNSWLSISNTYKTYRNFTFVQLQLEIVVKYRSLYIKILFYPLTLYWTMYFWKLFSISLESMW